MYMNSRVIAEENPILNFKYEKFKYNWQKKITFVFLLRNIANCKLYIWSEKKKKFVTNRYKNSTKR